MTHEGGKRRPKGYTYYPTMFDSPCFDARKEPCWFLVPTGWRAVVAWFRGRRPTCINCGTEKRG